MDIREQGCKQCRFQPITLSLAIGIFTCALYLPTVRFDFIHLDDGVYVVQNHLVNEGISVGKVLHAFVTTEVSYWHPLTWISHMLDCELFGLNAGGHHFINVLFHALNSVLLFLVLRSITGGTWKSFLVAALFAWHPLGVETVAWISERKNLLCTLFWILTIWSHWRYAKRPSAKRNLLTLLFLLMAFMTKPMAVSLPFILLLMDIWPLKRFPKAIETHGSLCSQVGHLLLEKLNLFILTFFICILTIIAQKNANAVQSLNELGILPRITNAIITYAAYLGKMVWPVDLAVLYPFTNQVRLGMTILCALGLLIVTGIVLLGWKKKPWYMVGWFWYLITLIPMIGLFQVGSQSMADRYTYVPLIGIFIMTAWGFEDLVKRRPKTKSVLIGFCSIALMLCIYKTRSQIALWKDTATLFSHTLAVTENNWKAHFAISFAYAEQRNWHKAETHIRQSLALGPDKNRKAKYHIKLAQVLIEQNQYNNAKNEIEKALKLKPDYTLAYHELGRLYQQQNNPKKALSYYEKCIILNPYSFDAMNQMAWILSTSVDSDIRNGEVAIHLCKKMVAFFKIPPTDYLCTLAAAYAEVGRFEDALQTGQRALEIANTNEIKKDKELRERIADSLSYYRKNQPYRDPLPSAN